MFTVCTISILLWAVSVLNFNPVLEDLRTTDHFNFTNFLGDRVMDAQRKVPVIAALTKRFQAISFRESYC